MISRHQGFILLTTVVMMIVITVFILSMLKTVILYTKTTNQRYAHHKNFYELETITPQFILKNDVHCLVGENDPNQMIQRLLKGQGCPWKQGEAVYYYLVSDLGVYACLRILSEQKWVSSHHWLVAVMVSSPQQVLQLRIATPAKQKPCDASRQQRIGSGIISWRYLPS
jgi:hypothetical protein